MRHIEHFQCCLVQLRNRPVKSVRVEAEGSQPVQRRQVFREQTGEVVVGQIKNQEPVERQEGEGKCPGEIVVVEEQSFEIYELGEIGEGAEERVVAQTQNSELVESAQSARRDGPTEAGALHDEAHNAALRAFDALPLAVIEALVSGVE